MINRIRNIACALLLAFAMPAYADDGPADVRAVVAGAQGQVIKAVVIAGPVKFSFRRLMHEKDLPSIGCEYRFDDPAAIFSLMAILSRTQFTEDMDADRPVSVGLGIYLDTRDGASTKMIFGRTFADGHARGVLNGAGKFVAKAPFDKDIRALLATMPPSTVHYQCDRDDILSFP